MTRIAEAEPTSAADPKPTAEYAAFVARKVALSQEEARQGRLLTHEEAEAAFIARRTAPKP